jgi:hypothetical protein
MFVFWRIILFNEDKNRFFLNGKIQLGSPIFASVASRGVRGAVCVCVWVKHWRYNSVLLFPTRLTSLWGGCVTREGRVCGCANKWYMSSKREGGRGASINCITQSQAIFGQPPSIHMCVTLFRAFAQTRSRVQSRFETINCSSLSSFRPVVFQNVIYRPANKYVIFQVWMVFTKGQTETFLKKLQGVVLHSVLFEKVSSAQQLNFWAWENHD